MKLIGSRSPKTFALAAVGTTLGAFVFSGILGASGGEQPAVDELITGADRVVVAKARTVAARWQGNEYGDRIIVSRIELDVEETLKGAAEPVVSLDVDGGTLDGLTLRVSGLDVLESGERAVLFLDAPKGRVHAPHRRGDGILILDDQNMVKDTNLGLNEIRAKARGLAK